QKTGQWCSKRSVSVRKRWIRMHWQRQCVNMAARGRRSSLPAFCLASTCGVANFLHKRDDLSDLLRIVAVEEGSAPALVGKDYWIMHCLHGLQILGLSYELKGGTALSKGFGLINRFSEDIDIRIEPPTQMLPQDMDVKMGRNHDKPTHRESRKQFYDWLVDY